MRKQAPGAEGALAQLKQQVGPGQSPGDRGSRARQPVNQERGGIEAVGQVSPVPPGISHLKVFSSRFSLHLTQVAKKWYYTLV